MYMYILCWIRYLQDLHYDFKQFISMSANVILTTGIYDLIKDHVRRKKVTIEQEEILLAELKKASQVLRKDLPEDIAYGITKAIYSNTSKISHARGASITIDKALEGIGIEVHKGAQKFFDEQ